MSPTAVSRHLTPRPPLSLLLFLLLLSPAMSDDLQILLRLKSSLQAPSTSVVLNSWTDSSNSPCGFTGIACDPLGSVAEIELSSQGLSGVLPLDLICELGSLTKLSLGFNSFSGKISEGLRNCTKLKYLDLGNNQFGGEFPDISALAGLEYLYLNNSGISGAFPWKSLAGMKGLVRLSLGDNPLEESEFPREVLGLTKLNWLYLANCSLQGTIPAEIGNLVELINLELSQNNFTGEIPGEIGKLSKLWQLELFENGLTGKLPASMVNLTSLANFDASANGLEGDLSALRKCNNLVSLQLFDNKFSGEIPREFGEFKSLVNLSLYTNQLTGTLPEKLGSWAEFIFIDVSENFLTGPIPPHMCKKGTMTLLLILQNNFTGPIPETYANCPTLVRFRVSKNSLSGTVPSGIWGLPKLDIIDIENNAFEGPITSDIAGAKSLKQLVVGHNRLTGELPEEISEAKMLVSIQMNDNRLSGKIPAAIGESKKLGTLRLDNNMLSGGIPKQLGSSASLSVLNFANNSLTGKIPSSLGSLPNLNSLNLSNNELSGEIPSSVASIRLSLLDLSNNKLSGRIPQALSIAAYHRSFDGNPDLCSVEISKFRRCPAKSGMSKDLRTLIICFAVGSAVLLISLACFTYLKRSEKDDDKDRSLKEESWDVKSYQVLTFTEDEILDSITQENVIGKGGSGNVYRVAVSNGKELAVKHIWNDADSKGKRRTKTTTPMLAKRDRQRSQRSKEFDAEVRTLSSIRHVNVVKLYCSITSDDSSLLVYEYLPNGSLWDRLHGCRKMKLDWASRYDISVGAAKGLEYLHHGCDRPVIHRDVKSSNILLDEFLKPRIADFGLAKMVQASSNPGGQNSTHVIAGTHGYIAPGN